jgi:NH3-dependent NAD+ synthetase
MLGETLGVDNMVELAVGWFDGNGDGRLDRQEYFELSKTIDLENLRKEAQSKFKDEIRASNSDADVHSSDSPKDEL